VTRLILILPSTSRSLYTLQHTVNPLDVDASIYVVPRVLIERYLLIICYADHSFQSLQGIHSYYIPRTPHLNGMQRKIAISLWHLLRHLDLLPQS